MVLNRIRPTAYTMKIKASSPSIRRFPTVLRYQYKVQSKWSSDHKANCCLATKPDLDAMSVVESIDRLLSCTCYYRVCRQMGPDVESADGKLTRRSLLSVTRALSHTTQAEDRSVDGKRGSGISLNSTMRNDAKPTPLR